MIVLVRLDRASAPKLHSSSRERRKAILAAWLRRVRTAVPSTLWPVHQLVGVGGGRRVDHVADVVLVHAFDCYSGWRRAHAGQVDDVVVAVFVAAAAAAVLGWGGVCLHGVHGAGGVGHVEVCAGDG